MTTRPWTTALANAVANIIHHMNVEHGRNLCDYCMHYLAQTIQILTLAKIDCYGMVWQSEEALSRIVFLREVRHAVEETEVLAEMARDARSCFR